MILGMHKLARPAMIFLLVMMGLEIGAGLYEMSVIVPLWSHDPQSAHLFWTAHPQFAPQPGSRWWMFSTPLTGLAALCTLFLAGSLPQRQARLLRKAAACVVLLVVATFAWFVPLLLKLQGPQVLNWTADAAMQKAALWAEWNWVRGLVYVLAWLVVIRAATLPASDSLKSSS
jgi:hypothetical protein